MAKSPRLTIIILNYNTQEWVSKCLQSIQKYHGFTADIKVVVVDNASTDNSLSHIAEQFPRVETISSSENIGFAGGNNLALRQVTTPYAMLLNSDTEFTSATHLEVLLNYLDDHQEAAVITPRVELPNGDLDWACHRGEPTIWAAFTYYSGLAKMFPQSRLFARYTLSYLDRSTAHRIEACSGAAMIVRVSAIDQVGFLDERFFMYAEDLDWCRRFREAGFTIVFHPGAVLVHHKYKSGLQQRDRHAVRRTRHAFFNTMLQYFDKHDRHRYPFFVRWWLWIFIQLKKGVG